jgi:adenosylcobinamide-GDP ribazoletransferase
LPIDEGLNVSGLVGAVQFLTRVPIRTRQAIPASRSVPWFPVAGALIGLAVGAIAAGMYELVPPGVAAAVAVLAGVLITGAFHEDGLADTFDAIAGAFTRERRLEILDDPRHGTYGVAALCGSIVLRIVCVASVGPAAAFAGLVSAHVLGRSAATVTIVSQPSATRHGLGATAVRDVPTTPAVIGAISGVAVTAVAVGWWIAVLVPVVVVSTAMMVAVARRALGGVNGDVLGAVEQLGECATIVAITALGTRHPIWWQ